MDGSSIDCAEGRVFYFEDENSLLPGFLQTTDYFSPRQGISYQMNKFVAVCPFSELSDIGIVWVDYFSQKKLVELKFLNYYSISFSNVGIYQEDVISRKYNDLNPLLEPEELFIKLALEPAEKLKQSAE